MFLSIKNTEVGNRKVIIDEAADCLCCELLQAAEKKSGCKSTNFEQFQSTAGEELFQTLKGPINLVEPILVT